MALIKGLKLPATPRIYEFCYAYATGDYPSLNMAINDLLNRRIAIGDATIRQIGAKHIPQSHNGEGIDHVGLRVKQVIGEVLGALGTIINAEDAFSSDIEETEAKLLAAKNRQALIDEIKAMMQSAQRLGDEQRRLDERGPARPAPPHLVAGEHRQQRDARGQHAERPPGPAQLTALHQRENQQREAGRHQHHPDRVGPRPVLGP